LAHSGNVSTLYGHLSRFARNVHLGSHVQQGEVIAYVGMTGLATGPHLHYEYLIDGVHKNPEIVHLPGAEPLRAEAMQQFQLAAAPLLARLTPPPAGSAPGSTAVAAVPAPPGPGAAAGAKRSAR
jgi:murein DD-endopeptidase MepM/ murein hydrolase activator NlpD